MNAIPFLLGRCTGRFVVDLNAVIEVHLQGFRHRPSSPCGSMLGMQRARSLILEKLCRQDEAAEAREKSLIQPEPCPITPYASFHEKLGNLPMIPQ